MNFYGHLVIGLRIDADPSFLLGTMLPDFASMAGLRLSASSHPTMSAGIGFHHDTDAAFHRAPIFTDMTAAGVEALEGAGITRGTARAVAHVGLELLLDGLLVEQADGPGEGPYREALRQALSPSLQAHIETDRGAGDPRFTTLIQRLSDAPVPAGYREPAFVAERLQHVLARRPRLAMGPGDGPKVQAWLTRARRALAASRERLIEQVQAELQ